MFIDRKQLDIDFLNEHTNLSALVLFDNIELAGYFNDMKLFTTNPFMPKEIVKSLNFLSIGHFVGVESNPKYQNEYVRIGINKKINNISDLKECSRPNMDLTFKDFLNNYLECLKAIEKWINKHSNIKADLNL